VAKGVADDKGEEEHAVVIRGVMRRVQPRKIAAPCLETFALIRCLNSQCENIGGKVGVVGRRIAMDLKKSRLSMDRK
jgi:hypothetical protein